MMFRKIAKEKRPTVLLRPLTIGELVEIYGIEEWHDDAGKEIVIASPKGGAAPNHGAEPGIFGFGGGDGDRTV